MKLSNTVKIRIEEPHIVALQRWQFFKNAIVQKLSLNHGACPKKVQRPIDIILSEGLLEFTKKLDLDFFSTDKAIFTINMFKPALIEVRKSQGFTLINIMTIKNTAEPKDYHYLQAFVYKLILEEALKGTTIKPYKVGMSLIYRNSNILLADDIDNFNLHMNAMDFFIEEKTDQNLCGLTNLTEIASLKAQQDKSKCETCVGMQYCDIYHNIDYKDKFAWFRKFE